MTVQERALECWAKINGWNVDEVRELSSLFQKEIGIIAGAIQEAIAAVRNARGEDDPDSAD